VEKLDDGLKSLVELGKRKGYLTYTQVNDYLPDEAVNPDKLDGLLLALEEQGIDLIDEAEAEEREGGSADTDDEEQPASPLDDEPAEEEFAVAEVEEETSRRIDDPVRMYLTQMGEIPLLTREQEISLAKKIEVTRKRFRRKVLECDYALRAAVTVLQQVHRGELPFDRTIKVSVTENLEKTQILGRMPHNLATLEHLLALNIKDYRQMMSPRNDRHARMEAWRSFRTRRRKAVTLVEELSLRTQRVQPLMKKLEQIAARMSELERQVGHLKRNGAAKEDRQCN